MADKLDLVHLIGSKTCAVASNLTELVAGEPACHTGEVWNMGALVLGAVIAGLAVAYIAERRKYHRESFFR